MIHVHRRSAGTAGLKLAHGRRANVPLVAAVALGDPTAVMVSLLGLAALLAKRPV